MNKILFTLLTILILTPLSGVQNSIEINPNDILKEYELPDSQRKSWNDIKEKWMRNDYHSCLNKFHLKMSCGGCVYIYMKAEITIGDNNKISGYRKTGDNVCSKKIPPLLEKCFMRSFKQQTFPEELKNIKFETMLGTGLKC